MRCPACAYRTTNLEETICPLCDHDLERANGELKAYTVQVGYYGHNSDTVVIEGEPDADLNDLLEGAIRLTNDAGNFKATDHVTDSFVDRVVEGRHPTVWGAEATKVTVPRDFTEAHVLTDVVGQKAPDLLRVVLMLVGSYNAGEEVQETSWEDLNAANAAAREILVEMGWSEAVIAAVQPDGEVPPASRKGD
jgi:hypothetical protein